MKRFLRWLLGIDRDALYESMHVMSQELQDVRDAQDHLGRRFTRLQQQVTRWSREYDEELEDDDNFDELVEEKRRERA